MCRRGVSGCAASSRGEGGQGKQCAGGEGRSGAFIGRLAGRACRAGRPPRLTAAKRIRALPLVLHHVRLIGPGRVFILQYPGRVFF
jgi:hypothetical protein